MKHSNKKNRNFFQIHETLRQHRGEGLDCLRRPLEAGLPQPRQRRSNGKHETIVTSFSLHAYKTIFISPSMISPITLRRKPGYLLFSAPSFP